jgi:hypothetical protein
VRPGNVELVQVVTSMTVCTGGIAAILRLDERWVRRIGRPAAWLPVTRDAAVFGTFLFSWLYGGPALVIHFVKSRGWLVGAALGVLMAALLVATDVGAQIAAEAAIDWLGL